MRKDPDGVGPNWEVLWLQMEKAILEIQKKMPFFPPGGSVMCRGCEPAVRGAYASNRD